MTSSKVGIYLTSIKKSWGDVTQAYWRKNPSPFSKHIISEDVVYRGIVNGKLQTTRLLVKHQKIPRLLQQIIPKNYKFAYVKETSIVDPTTQECTITQENLNCQNVLHVVETIRMKPRGLLETVLERKTRFKGAVSKFTREWAMKKYEENIKNTDKAIMCVLGLIEGCSFDATLNKQLMIR